MILISHSYIPLKSSDFESRYKIQYKDNYEQLISDLYINSTNSYQKFEEEDYGLRDVLYSSPVVLKQILKQSLFAVFKKPIIFKVWQNLVIENGNSGGYDVATPGLWGSGEVNRTRLTYINGREEDIDEAIATHIDSIEKAIDTIKTKRRSNNHIVLYGPVFIDIVVAFKDRVSAN